MRVAEEPSQLDLRHYLAVLGRRKWSIVLVTLVVTGLAVAYTNTRTDVYEASTSVLLRRPNVASVDDTQYTQSEIVRRVEAMFFNSEQVQDEAEGRLDGAADVSVQIAPEGVDLTVTATGSDPSHVADAANAYADAYIDLRLRSALDDFSAKAEVVQAQITELNTQIEEKEWELELALAAGEATTLEVLDSLRTERDALVTQRTVLQQRLDSYNLNADLADSSGPVVVQRAATPSTPVSPRPMRDIPAGIALGLLAGVALAAVREALDDSVKSKADLARVVPDLPILAAIPRLKTWHKKSQAHVIALEHPKSPVTEAYRGLRTSIQFATVDEPLKTLQVTSPQAGDGKSTTIANLGVVLGRSGQRVLLVDCDLRQPRLHQFFGLSNRVGFTSVVLDEAELSEAIQMVPGEPNLAVLPSGPEPPDPAELLGAARSRALIEALRSRCDLLVIDSPPILPVTDALVLSHMADATVLVLRADVTTSGDVATAVESIQNVSGPLLGGVLNSVTDLAGYGYGYGRRYGSSGRARRQEPPLPRRRQPNRRVEAVS